MDPGLGMKGFNVGSQQLLGSSRHVEGFMGGRGFDHGAQGWVTEGCCKACLELRGCFQGSAGVKIVAKLVLRPGGSTAVYCMVVQHGMVA